MVRKRIPVGSPSICVVNVYFGILPPCFEKWLESCSWNPTVDFLIITDQDIGSHPPNVRVEQSTLESVRALAEDILGFTVALDRPYKLCDFKPLYGRMFESMLVGYDYWGHCDVDMVFGNLRKFFDANELGKYQRFLDLGHLSLYRNDETMLHAYSLPLNGCRPFKRAFAEAKSVAFDEGGMRAICSSNNIKMFDKRIFADISKIYHRFRLALNDVNYEHQAFFVENGGVWRAFITNGKVYLEEFIYIHFKERQFSGHQVAGAKGETCYFIGPDGFTPKRLGMPSSLEIDAANPPRKAFFEAVELQQFRIREKACGLFRRFGLKSRR